MIEGNADSRRNIFKHKSRIQSGFGSFIPHMTIRKA